MRIAAVQRIGLPIVAAILWVIAATPAHAIPAFARKYGLPCSACHEAWPKLSNFGQVFRDNGYQLGNDRDAPIYQQPSYWPIMFRIPVEWHRENSNRVPLDTIPGDPTGGISERPLTTAGFDISGLDIFTAGTLYKNISFGLQPIVDTAGKIHIQTAFVRFDNLLHSPWLNFKFGKFELDTLISEKRMLTLNNTDGFYYNYHFRPPSDSNTFGGIGDPQLGIELMGHSKNSYTRYSVAMLSSNDGQSGLPTNKTYDFYGDFTQGFEIKGLGLQRIGAYAYIGKSPTYFQTSGGTPVAGAGSGNRSFYRAGAYGLWYLGKFDFATFYMHGADNVFLGTSTPANDPSALPVGAKGPTWNGGFVEAHYTYNPQLILVARYELVRMDRVTRFDKLRSFGSLDAWTIGYRWYPIMSSRAGLAWVQEYSRGRFIGTAPLTGRDENSSSYLMGFDFDF